MVIFNKLIFMGSPKNIDKVTKIEELYKDQANKQDSDFQKNMEKIKTALQFYQTAPHQSQIPIQCISLFC